MVTCQGHALLAVQFANRNGNLVSASADGTIRTWKWSDGTLLHVMENAHQGAVRGLAWTEHYMISGGFRDGLLRVWDNESNELRSERQTGGMAIWQVASGEGKLAVASRVQMGTHLLELWDMEEIERTGL